MKSLSALLAAVIVLIAGCRTHPAKTAAEIPKPAPVAAPTAASPAPHNFDRWEKEVAAYEAKDKTNPPPKDPLVFTGASMIRKWTSLAQDFPGQPVLNRGVGGSEIVDITHFADRIIFPYQPRMIFFRSGGNDIHNGKSVEQVFNDYKEFVATVHARLPETDIVFISLSPSIARWEQHDKEKQLNDLVKAFSLGTSNLKYCEDYDIVLGPDGQPRPELFVADKQHFNAEGYKLLAERVRPFLP
jgi:lysophospholipase L1-like esterase